MAPRVARRSPDAHWPRGKRRHAESDTAITRAFLADLAGVVHPVSRRSCAAAIGVSDRTIRRWLSGEDLPASSTLKALRRWYAQRETR